MFYLYLVISDLLKDIVCSSVYRIASNYAMIRPNDNELESTERYGRGLLRDYPVIYLE
jgi:hypothetical protein